MRKLGRKRAKEMAKGRSGEIRLQAGIDRMRRRAERKLRNEEIRKIRNAAFLALTKLRKDRAKEMILMRKSGKTLKEIGHLYGVSGERVRKITAP